MMEWCGQAIVARTDFGSTLAVTLDLSPLATDGLHYAAAIDAW